MRNKGKSNYLEHRIVELEQKICDLEIDNQSLSKKLKSAQKLLSDKEEFIQELMQETNEAMEAYHSELEKVYRLKLDLEIALGKAKAFEDIYKQEIATFIDAVRKRK